MVGFFSAEETVFCIPLNHLEQTTIMHGRVIIIVFVGLCLTGPLRADVPLYEQDPFDEVTLDESNRSAVLKVLPLDLPNRQVPEKHAPGDVVVIRLADQPEKKFEVAWESIKKVVLFEQMLLDKAGELMRAGKRDEAYAFYRFLDEKYSRAFGLAAAYEEYLLQEAKALHEQRRYRNALAMLRELFRRNPRHPKLEKAMGAMTDKLAERYLADADYRSARALVENLSTCYPEHPLAAQWTLRFRKEADKLLTDAKAAQALGDLRKAAVLSRRILLVCPTLEGAKELAEDLCKKYPRVVVGVCQSAPEACCGRTGGDVGLLTDWATRRTSRLTHRTLTQFVGVGVGGGRYDCPVGRIKIDGCQINVQLDPNQRWSNGEAVLSGYDVSRRLMAMADPADPAYRPDWARLFKAVTVQDVYRIEIEIASAHRHPEAMLQTMLLPYTMPRNSEAERLPALGCYVYADQSDAETVFVRNVRYSGGNATQPQEVVEHRFADSAAAARALQRGEIQVLDRVGPRQIPMLRADKNVVVQPYALPLTHCLVPNGRKPLMSNRAFRRALAYGIDRQAVLGRILQGVSSSDGTLLTGLTPGIVAAKDSTDNLLGVPVKPWVFDPGLAMVLAEAGRREVYGAKESGSPPTTSSLVLAHPPSDVARTACTAIQQQLAAVGIAVRLKELPSVAVRQIPDDADLLYVELALWEPAVDVPRVLGDDGLLARCSPSMSEALWRLEQAKDIGASAIELHRIDCLVRDEAAVLPLWQLTDYFACRASLEGIRPRTLALYQDIQRWKLAN